MRSISPCHAHYRLEANGRLYSDSQDVEPRILDGVLHLKMTSYGGSGEFKSSEIMTDDTLAYISVRPIFESTAKVCERKFFYCKLHLDLTLRSSDHLLSE